MNYIKWGISADEAIQYVLTVGEKHHINAVNNTVYFQKGMKFGEPYK